MKKISILILLLVFSIICLFTLNIKVYADDQWALRPYEKVLKILSSIEE